MKTYKIDEKRLRELLKAEMTLDALECAGVDNWNGYGEHWDMYLDLEDYEDNGLHIDLDSLIEDHIDYRLELFIEVQDEFVPVLSWADIVDLEKKIDVLLAAWYKVDYYEYDCYTSFGNNGFTVHWIDLDTSRTRNCIISNENTDELETLIRGVWNNG